jgi:dihydroorotate dehydrogenase electron transfer subunit
MRYFEARVAENRQLGGGYFLISLNGCGALAASAPGQFVMLRGDWERDPLLPRAFSLLSVGPDGRAAILAKTVGRGTALLERALPGESVSVLGPLGSKFPAPTPEFTDLLVGGGVGIPPIYMQAEAASRRGLAQRSEVIYGGRSTHDLVLLAEMNAFGVALFLTTDDGTRGRGGLVTAELAVRLDQHSAAGTPVRILACGPNAMLWAVARMARERGIPCFISVEEQMACGIGVCLGCAVPARSRPFRYVCKDGPVFEAAEILDVATGAVGVASDAACVVTKAPAECPS